MFYHLTEVLASASKEWTPIGLLLSHTFTFTDSNRRSSLSYRNPGGTSIYGLLGDVLLDRYSFLPLCREQGL